jgi:phage-related protein (TIGR01555 family)
MAASKLLMKPKVTLADFVKMQGESQSEQSRMMKAFASDAFSNPAAKLGFGTANIMEATQYPLTRLSRNYILMVSLYRTNWIVRKVIDAKAEDMLKNGWSLDTQRTPEQITQFEKVVTDTATIAKLVETVKWSRLYGGSSALLVIKGQKNLEAPLNVEDVDLDSYKGLLVFDRWSGISPGATLNTDLDDPVHFGEPEFYEITTSSSQRIRVHSSRLLKFTGRILPLWERQAEQYWGISEVEIMFEELRKRDNTSWNIASLVFRANVFGLRQKDLSQMLSGIGSSQAAQLRFWQTIQAQSDLMSNMGMFVLPEDGGLETHQYGFSGISDVYEQFMLDVCGATEYPMSRLFGRTVTGLGQGNEGDEHSYYDNIGQLQKQQVDPNMRKLMPVIAMSTWGEVPEDLAWSYNPVRSLTDKDKSDLAKSYSDSINQTFTNGIVGRQTALKELKQQSGTTGLFTNITDKTIEEADDEPMDMSEMGDEGEGGEGKPGDEPKFDAPGDSEESEGATNDASPFSQTQDWEESKHPREAAGTGKGGQFTSKEMGSQSAPLKWSNPNYRVASVYRDKDGKWMYQTANKEWIAASLLPAEWQTKIEKSFETLEEHEEAKSSEQQEITVVSQEKKKLAGSDLKKFLNEPANQKTVTDSYKQGFSTGSIAKALGLPQDKQSRSAIRSLLRKAGLYKEINKVLGQQVPDKIGSGFEKIKSELSGIAEQYAGELYPVNVKNASANAFIYADQALEKSKKFYAAAKVSNAKEALSATINRWTSSSHSEGAQIWKAIAAEHYGKDIEIEPKLSIPVNELKNKASVYKDAMLATKELTSSWVKKYGAKQVYRGLTGAVATEIKKQLKEGATEIELNANVLSSWSESESKAGSFGSGGVILKMKVNPDDVWGCYAVQPYSGFVNFKSEKEYVMGIPGKTFKIRKEDINLA